MKLTLLTVWTAAGLTLTGFSQEAAQQPDAQYNKNAAFLTRIRLADPGYRLILIACLKENELNLLLSRHATAEEIPILVKGLLTLLSKELPGKDLRVVAFRPVSPLREAAVARLNSQTGQISYLVDPERAAER